MKNLYLIGGGGHCKSCIDVIEATGDFSIMGIFDQVSNVGKKVLNYEIIGTDDDIKNYVSAESYFLITVGQIKSAEPRINIFKILSALKANIAIVISPRSHVSKYAKIGAGTIVMHDSLINADAVVGENCIINTKSLIEHDVFIQSHCHISTAAVVNGNCAIEEGSFVGSNAVLREGLKIPANTIIPAGSFYNAK